MWRTDDEQKYMNHFSCRRFRVGEKPVFYYSCIFGGSLDLSNMQEELSIYENMAIRVRVVLRRKVLILMQVLLLQSLTVFPLDFDQAN